MPGPHCTKSIQTVGSATVTGDGDDAPGTAPVYTPSRRDRVLAFITEHLKPGESVAAVLSEAEVGHSRTVVEGLRSRRCSVVVTDQRVFIVAESGWTGLPKKIRSEAARDQIQVTEWNPASGRLVLSGLNGATELQVRLLDATSLLDEATAVVGALSPELAAHGATPNQAGSTSVPEVLSQPSDARIGIGFGVLYVCCVGLLAAVVIVPLYFLVSYLTGGGGGTSTHAGTRSQQTEGSTRATTTTAPARRPGSPTTAVATAPQFGRSVYQAPLSAPTPDIGAASDPFGSARFVGQQYVVSETKASSYFTITPGDLHSATGLTSAPTVAIDVTATPTTASDGDYGVMCRASQSGDVGYAFSIFSDGQASISRFDMGDVRRLAQLPPSGSPAIVQGANQNRLRAICSGGEGQPVDLTLVVNGQQVLQATDTQNPLSPGGTFQLFVEDAGQPVSAAFSTLVVQVP